MNQIETAMSNTTVKTILATSPIVTKENRHDDGRKLLSMRHWLLFALATPDLVGREKAADTRTNVDTLKDIRDSEPELWKQLSSRYSEEKKAYNKTVASMAKGKQTSSIRQFRESGTIIRVQRHAADFDEVLQVQKRKAIMAAPKG